MQRKNKLASELHDLKQDTKNFPLPSRRKDANSNNIISDNKISIGQVKAGTKRKADEPKEKIDHKRRKIESDSDEDYKDESAESEDEYQNESAESAEDSKDALEQSAEESSKSKSKSGSKSESEICAHSFFNSPNNSKADFKNQCKKILDDYKKLVKENKAKEGELSKAIESFYSTNHPNFTVADFRRKCQHYNLVLYLRETDGTTRFLLTDPDNKNDWIGYNARPAFGDERDITPRSRWGNLKKQ